MQSHFLNPLPIVQNQIQTKPLLQLPIISSIEDILKFGDDLQLADSTIQAFHRLQETKYSYKLNIPNVDCAVSLEKLASIFKKYKIPIGMIHHLLTLEDKVLCFIIDDSGSMRMFSDDDHQLTRWEQLKNRLNEIVEILAYVPIKKIKFKFLNRNHLLDLSHEGITPDRFLADAQRVLNDLFKIGPYGGTPLYQCLAKTFCEHHDEIYLFTDGAPSDCRIHDLKALIQHQNNSSPLSIICYGNDEAQTQWIEELHDFRQLSRFYNFSESKQIVAQLQRHFIPYTEGIWLLSQLTHLNFYKKKPWSKSTLENIMGYRVSEVIYQAYLNNHPRWGYQNIKANFSFFNNPPDVRVEEVYPGRVPIDVEKLFAGTMHLVEFETFSEKARLVMVARFQNVIMLIRDYGISIDQLRSLSDPEFEKLITCELTKIKALHDVIPIPKFLQLLAPTRDEIFENLESIAKLASFLSLNEILNIKNMRIRKILYECEDKIIQACDIISILAQNTRLDNFASFQSSAKILMKTLSGKLDDNNNSFLQLAILNNQMNLTKYLLCQDVELNHRNREDESALEIAAARGYTEIVLTLILKNIEIKKVGFPATPKAINLALQNNHPETAKEIRKASFLKDQELYDKKQAEIFDLYAENESLRMKFK